MRWIFKFKGIYSQIHGNMGFLFLLYYYPYYQQQHHQISHNSIYVCSLLPLFPLSFSNSLSLSLLLFFIILPNLPPTPGIITFKYCKMILQCPSFFSLMLKRILCHHDLYPLSTHLLFLLLLSIYPLNYKSNIPK